MALGPAGPIVSGVPRRILLLVTDLQIGGTPTVVRELATRLHDPTKGIQVEVACLSKWGPVADQIRDAGVTVTALNATHSWQLRAVVKRLRRLVRDHSIDTVFSFLLHANAAAALASRELPGVRFLQSIQTVQRWPLWHWWVQRRIHRGADKVVVPSSAVAKVARERCKVPAEKILVIPNAVDPDDFPRVPVFERGEIRIGYLGRLDPVKNLDLFVATVGRLVKDSAPEDRPVEGHIFGDGPMRPQLDMQIRGARLKDKVFLRGPVARPQDALREMDLLFFPSGGEGFGLVLIEAMASGVPVLAMSRGGVTDVVRHGVNGWLFDVGPDGDFRVHLDLIFADLLHDPVAATEDLIANGLATVRERFSWDVVLPQYRALLRIPS